MTTENNAAQPAPTKGKDPNEDPPTKGGVAGVDSKPFQNDSDKADAKEKNFDLDSKTG